ncbi:MAG: DEAD/DEAH box helicase [Candidatus Marsarchaeota archaeon]|nr:DEAD/DEAH box helicase [Candidatus Marsarchaeota archaeon]
MGAEAGGEFIRTDLIEPREYQLNIIKSILHKNSLVVLPTGLGKTIIALYAMSNALSHGKKAMMLSPTKPLAEQHYNSAVRLMALNPNEMALITGAVAGAGRSALEAGARVVLATPQTIANDIKAGRLDIKDYGVVVFDECHRAMGKYAYTYIADEAKLNSIRTLGLTASPGSSEAKIKMLTDILGIQNIEVRGPSDEDVYKYIAGKKTSVIYVDRNLAVNEIISLLRPVIEEHFMKLKKYGFCYFKTFESIPKARFLEIGKTISNIKAPNYRFIVMFEYIYLLHLMHAYDLISTESIFAFYDYFERLKARAEKSRAVSSILNNRSIGIATALAKKFLDRGQEHEKMLKLVQILKTDLSGKTVIIFAQYRATISKIVEILNANALRANAFLGKKGGVTNLMQKDIIDRFRLGVFKILVATSIGEEGLDIPSVDAVVFYEPVSSEIRNIQRRGRAGRISFGNIIILVARNSKDEVHLNVSRFRELRMQKILQGLQKNLSREYRHSGTGQQRLA